MFLDYSRKSFPFSSRVCSPWSTEKIFAGLTWMPPQVSVSHELTDVFGLCALRVVFRVVAGPHQAAYTQTASRPVNKDYWSSRTVVREDALFRGEGRRHGSRGPMRRASSESVGTPEKPWIPAGRPAAAQALQECRNQKRREAWAQLTADEMSSAWSYIMRRC